MNFRDDIAEVEIRLSAGDRGSINWFVLAWDESGASRWIADGETGPFDDGADLHRSLYRALVHRCVRRG